MLLLLFLLLGATVIFLFTFVYKIGKTFVCVKNTYHQQSVFQQKWFIAIILLEHCAFAIGTLRLCDWCIATTFGAFR